MPPLYYCGVMMMPSLRDAETQTKQCCSAPLSLCGLCLCVALAAGQTRSQSTPLPQGSFAQNFEYVGFTNLNGHLPFKIDIQQANGRWYMYAGGESDRGWCILHV